MKNILAKFKINGGTYFLLLASLITGFFKNISIILLIVIVHELGHILVSKYHHYTIKSVEIFPFGGITKLEKPMNTPLKQELSIAFAGITFQILLYFLFFFFYQKNIILQNTFSLFQNYNKIILIFNLLPLIPLDGSIIIHTCLEYFFSYYTSYYIYLGITFISFIFFATYHTIYSLNNYMILFFLIYKGYDAFKKRKYYQNRFYLERYLYEYPYQRIESHNTLDLTKLKKETLHFFWYKDRYLHEKEILQKHYQNPS